MGLSVGLAVSYSLVPRAPRVWPLVAFCSSSHSSERSDLFFPLWDVTGALVPVLRSLTMTSPSMGHLPLASRESPGPPPSPGATRGAADIPRPLCLYLTFCFPVHIHSPNFLSLLFSFSLQFWCL